MTEDTRKLSDWTAAARKRIKAFLYLLARKTSHEEVIEQVRADGQLSGRYIFMAVMSCGIAILGLLLSSPAVVIGAMLISPLMGPIMLMGFSLTILDVPAMRRAVFSMACGVVAALTISFLIVKLSPLTEVTPEILARTRPNLFDLLVAIFSGLAGGYAVIQRQGATIVGVAIATALMPPLAVTGFGLAVGSMAIAGGSFFLFMTNLLAIALSVTVLSKIYGFGAAHGTHNQTWQTVLIVGVFVALSIPLGLALRDIAYETRAINTVKSTLLVPFEGQEARISDVGIVVPRKGDIRVAATILTHERVPDAEQTLSTDLSTYLGRPVSVSLAQVLIDENKGQDAEDYLRMADISLAAPLRAKINELEAIGARQATASDLRRAIPFAVTAADIDPEAMTAKLIAAPGAGIAIGGYRSMEATLAANFPDWKIEVVPPEGDLPRIAFEEGSDKIAPEGEAAVSDCIWALQRWKSGAAEAVGHASSNGDQRFNRTLAERRGAAIAERLKAAGFTVTASADYRGTRQTADERRLGLEHFQTGLVRPES
jgi:uncharacterized hydrophobic protein (TIGR00271 family)